MTSTAGTDSAQSRLDVSAIASGSGGVCTVDNGGSGSASIVLANSDPEIALTAAQATTACGHRALAHVVIQTLDASAADISSVTNTGTVTLDLGDARYHYVG